MKSGSFRPIVYGSCEAALESTLVFKTSAFNRSAIPPVGNHWEKSFRLRVIYGARRRSNPVGLIHPIRTGGNVAAD